MRPVPVVLVALLLLAPTVAAAGETGGGGDAGGAELVLHEPVVVSAAAVAQTEEGLVGSVATISISVARNGSGHIFMDTVPLTQVDMQGSARLAVQVAGVVTGMDVSRYDFFFVVRSGSQIIGGPSAGAIMTVGTIAALKGWTVDPEAMMTGTINPDGSVGPVGGVPEKAAAAAARGATLFLFPEGQENARLGSGVVDMGEYCERELRIRCLPVADVEDAVRLVTGHEFERPELTGNVTDAEYKALMRPLASELYANATVAFDAAAADLAAAEDVPDVVRRELEESRARAEDALDAAERGLDAEAYYTTASKAFQSSIETRFIAYTLGFYEAEDGAAYADGIIAGAHGKVEAAGRAARSAEGVDAARLQAVGAAQVRASEAESRLASAEAMRENSTTIVGLVEAFYEVAYAFERAETAVWWLRIGSAFAGVSPTLDPQDLERAARESLASADESITYAEVILQEAGGPGIAVPLSRETLERARNDFENGYFVAATFQAVEAEVRANLAIELLGYEGGVPAGKVENARENAERAILLARERGYEPLLAVPYYEFAGSFDPGAEQLLFYSLARTLARLTQFLHEPSPDVRASRFVGATEEAGRSFALLPFTHAGAFLAMGVALGVVLAVIALVPSKELESRPERRAAGKPEWSTSTVTAHWEWGEPPER